MHTIFGTSPSCAQLNVELHGTTIIYNRYIFSDVEKIRSAKNLNSY